MASSRSVRSADGTEIGFRSYGRGPGLIVVHGAMETSADYLDLAEALAGTYTVHVPDRRGRGLSGPHGGGFGLSREVDDVRAVRRATAAVRIFGVSSGGVVALRAALDLPEIEQVAVYEPALSIPGADPRAEAYVSRFRAEIGRGDTADAVVTILKGMQVGPAWLRLLPRPIARGLVGHLLAEDAVADGEPTFAELVPTVDVDFRIADEGGLDLERFAQLDRPVLLLGGSCGPRYLKAALTRLAELLPAARRIELPGLNHAASSNRRQGGRPDLVAQRLLDFFGSGRS